MFARVWCLLLTALLDSPRVHGFSANPAIAGGDTAKLKPCPSTRWTNAWASENDLFNAGNNENNSKDPKDPKPFRYQRPVRFLETIRRPQDADNEHAWIQQHSERLLQQLQDHGALHFKEFQLPKTKSGFRQFCHALEPHLSPCEDALASIGVRSLLSRKDGIYRAVDKQSLANTFIGLHNDCTFTMAPPYAAFVCFQKATVSGGEFLLADGREILNALNTTIMHKLYHRGVRVRVASIRTNWFNVPPKGITDYENLLESSAVTSNLLKEWTSDAFQVIVGWGLKLFLPKLGLDLAYSKDRTQLQILEPLKSPVNCHPRTGEPTFFSGIHSQSAYLQTKRAGIAFDGVATTDVFYGETNLNRANVDWQMCEGLDDIEEPVLNHIEDVMGRMTKRVLMEPGDVVLLDSYQVLHGRNIFEGLREHGVVWLTSPEYDSSGEQSGLTANISTTSCVHGN